jgi:very-short-patch-repair endonuclease/transposase-like protein
VKRFSIFYFLSLFNINKNDNEQTGRGNMSKYLQQIKNNYDMVISEIEKGESLKYICETHDLNYHAFYKKIKEETPGALKRKNISTLRKKRYSEAQKIRLDEEKICQMYKDEHISARKIAKKFGVVQNTILRILRENGIEKNSQSLYWTDEMREAQRKKCYDGIIGIHSQGDGAYRFTQPERDFASWCDCKNIKYTRQYQIENGRHRYDFRIDGTFILVEIDGEFWHNTNKQKKKDLLFEKEAKEKGFTVIRFSDTMIQKTKTECFNDILSLI